MPFNQPQSQTKWLLAVALGLILLGLFMAYNHQLTKSETTGANAAKTQCAADTNAALLSATKQTLVKVEKQLNDANDAVKELRQEKSQNAELVLKLKGEIKRVTTTWIPPGKTQSEQLPACVLTNGFVRVYNQSVTGSAGSASMSAAVPATRADGAAKATSAVNTDLHPSHVGRSDVLQHITQYGARCNDIESQLNSLLDYLEKQGSKG